MPRLAHLPITILLTALALALLPGAGNSAAIMPPAASAAALAVPAEALPQAPSAGTAQGVANVSERTAPAPRNADQSDGSRGDALHGGASRRDNAQPEPSAAEAPLAGASAPDAAADPSSTQQPAPETQEPPPDATGVAQAQADQSAIAAVPGLEAVSATRIGNVVILDGEVSRDADRALAESVARAQTGAAEVVNQVDVTTSPSGRLMPTFRASLQRMQRMLASVPLVLIALGLAWALWRLGGWLATRGVIVRRLGKNAFLADLIKQAVRLVFGVVGLLIALEILDATSLAAALLGSAGVVGIALGFAFRDLLENYIASVLLSLRQPFAPDDVVAIDGHEGVVVGMNSRATVLMTHDGNHLRLPNALVFKAVTVNFTRNGKRRFEFVLAIDPSASASAAMQAGLEALREVPDVLAEPAPFVQLSGITREALNLQFFGWVDQRTGNFGAARSESMRRVRDRLRALGVDFGPPVMRLLSVLEDPDDAGRNAPRPPARSYTASKPEGVETEHAAVGEAVRRTRAEMGDTDLLDERGERE